MWDRRERGGGEGVTRTLYMHQVVAQERSPSAMMSRSQPQLTGITEKGKKQHFCYISLFLPHVGHRIHTLQQTQTFIIIIRQQETKRKKKEKKRCEWGGWGERIEETGDESPSRTWGLK